MARRKGTELSVFKGREAKLNRAIFQILASRGPMTIYEVSKEVGILRGLKHTKYTNVNRRMRTLEQANFLKKAGTRKTRAGFESSLYELTVRGLARMPVPKFVCEVVYVFDFASSVDGDVLWDTISIV